MNLEPYYVLFLDVLLDILGYSLSTVFDLIELLDLDDSYLI